MMAWSTAIRQLRGKLSALITLSLIIALAAQLACGLRQVATDADALNECSRHMHALGVALVEYASDHGGRLPDADRWVDEIYPYVKDRRVFRCPADPTKGRSSYGINVNLSGKRESDIEYLSNTVLLFECAHAGENPRGTADDLPSRGRHRYPGLWATARLYCFLFADQACYCREKPFEPAPSW